MKKINRSLYIGLGDTGISTLLHLKKEFLDAFGEIPPIVGFLGIDTCKGVFQKELCLENSNQSFHTIKLESFEQCLLSVRHLRDCFMACPEHYDWIPRDNDQFLRSLSLMTRTRGRFALIYSMEDVQNIIYNAIARISNVLANSINYQMQNENINIYLISSFAGATGSGGFIDMAYLIRRCMNNREANCHLFGYVALPTIFVEHVKGLCMNHAMANGYGTMLEMDWLMCHDWYKKPITLPLQKNGMKEEVNSAPFDICYFVDNKNIYNNVIDVWSFGQLVASHIFYHSIIKYYTTILEHPASYCISGVFDVQDKKAWTNGVGVCEVSVKTNVIRKIYACRVTKHLCASLLHHVEMSQETLDWINSPEVRICEHESDEVIDYLLDSNPIPMASISRNEYNNSANICHAYILSQTGLHEIEEQFIKLQRRIAYQLNSFVIATLNRSQNGGVGATLDMLQCLLGNIRLYIEEMKEEKEQCTQEEHYSVDALQLRTDELSCTCALFFQRRNALAHEIEEIATRLATIKREILRREYAIAFYNDLVDKIERHLNSIRLLEQNLNSVMSNCDFSISTMMVERYRPKPFEIDLTRHALDLVSFKESVFCASDFIESLSGDKIYGFKEKTANDISEILMNYTYGICDEEHVGNIDINSVLNAFTQEEFDRLFRQIIEIASPYLPIDFHGFEVGEIPSYYYLVFANELERNRLYAEQYFSNHIRNKSFVSFENSCMRDRLVILSQTSPIPPFAIASMAQCKEEYESPYRNRTLFHIDKAIMDDIVHNRFDLYPSSEKYPPIEESNLIELWVLGLLLGKIKNEDGRYFIQNEVVGDALKNYWIGIGMNRCQAFREYKTRFSLYAQDIKDCLDNPNNGTEIQKLIVEARKENGSSYLTQFSQLGLTLEELELKQNRELYDLIEAELEALMHL